MLVSKARAVEEGKRAGERRQWGEEVVMQMQVQEERRVAEEESKAAQESCASRVSVRFWRGGCRIKHLCLAVRLPAPQPLS